MKTSELFMDAFTDACGTPGIDCQFCGRTHFTHEEVDIDKMREKAAKEPDKYLESDDDSLAFGYLDGRQYVYGCPCDAGHKYEEFIWFHREQISKYLKARAAANLLKASEEAKILCQEGA